MSSDIPSSGSQEHLVDLHQADLFAAAQAMEHFFNEAEEKAKHWSKESFDGWSPEQLHRLAIHIQGLLSDVNHNERTAAQIRERIPAVLLHAHSKAAEIKTSLLQTLQRIYALPIMLQQPHATQAVENLTNKGREVIVQKVLPTNSMSDKIKKTDEAKPEASEKEATSKEKVPGLDKGSEFVTKQDLAKFVNEIKSMLASSKPSEVAPVVKADVHVHDKDKEHKEEDSKHEAHEAENHFRKVVIRGLKEFLQIQKNYKSFIDHVFGGVATEAKKAIAKIAVSLGVTEQACRSPDTLPLEGNFEEAAFIVEKELKAILEEQHEEFIKDHGPAVGEISNLLARTKKKAH